MENNVQNHAQQAKDTFAQVKEAAKTGHPTFIAATAYVFFLLPYFLGKQNDPFVRYHMNQALGLHLFGLVMQGIITIVGFWAVLFGVYSIPITLAWIARVIYVVLFYYGVKMAWSNEQGMLPWVGKHFPHLV